jgi:integrase
MFNTLDRLCTCCEQYAPLAPATRACARRQDARELVATGAMTVTCIQWNSNALTNNVSEAEKNDIRVTRYSSASGPPQDQTPSIDRAIEAWLDATNRNPGARTARTYTDVVTAFRRWLRERGLDLWSADPRWQRATANRSDPGDGDVLDVVDRRTRELATALEAYAATRVDAQRLRGPTSPATQALRIAAIASFYRFAFTHGYLRGPNPIDRVTRPPVDRASAVGSIPKPIPFIERLVLIDRTTDAGLRDYAYALLLIGLATGRRLSELWAMRLSHLTVSRDDVRISWPRCRGGSVVSDVLPLTGPDAAPAQALLARAARLMALRRAARDDVAWETGAVSELPLWVSLARNGTRGHQLCTGAIADICQKRLGVSRVQFLRYIAARSLEDRRSVTSILRQLGQRSLTATYVAAPTESPLSVARRHDDLLGTLSDLSGSLRPEVAWGSMWQSFPLSLADSNTPAQLRVHASQSLEGRLHIDCVRRFSPG